MKIYISGLNLNLSSLNEQLYTFGIPLEVIDGYVRNISIQIPWSALLTDSSQEIGFLHQTRLKKILKAKKLL